ncbi:glycosyltransferase family 4 protein [Rosettibacter firmus]|uniref:glycosyltransferase family 4 protein n=1 Tax=Rosettibacter firmus TaxID=3111522 RepID=UPI00336C2DFB
MRNKPRIAVIGLKGLPAFGGAASVGEELISKLKNKFDFTVYAISTHAYEQNYNGVTQIIFKEKKVSGFSSFKYYLRSLFHSLLFGNYDLIHLHHSESGFITPLLRLKYKVVLTIHGIFLDKYDPKFNKFINYFFRFSEKLNMKFANKVVSVSLIDKKMVEEHYNRECLYIPNGVNIIKIEKKEKEFDFLFIAARIYEIKGLHLLLSAIKTYNIKGKLLVIGDLNQDENYKNKIITLSKGMNVIFIPLLKDKSILYDYMKKSKIFIFPSLFEAMSMTLLEVISHKIPVLASDIISVKSIFDESEITFFRANDINDLAAKILYCQSNFNILIKKAEKAYNKVSQEYTWDKISSKYNHIYSTLIGC